MPKDLWQKARNRDIARRSALPERSEVRYVIPAGTAVQVRPYRDGATTRPYTTTKRLEFEACWWSRGDEFGFYRDGWIVIVDRDSIIRMEQ